MFFQPPEPEPPRKGSRAAAEEAFRGRIAPGGEPISKTMPRGEGKGKGEKGKSQGKGKGKGKFPGGAATGGAMMAPPPAPARAAPGGAGKGGKRYPSPGAAAGGAGKGRVTGVGDLPHERVHWKGDRELEAYYDDIRRNWMEDITENFLKFDPAWIDPQGYATPDIPCVVAHVRPPGGMRYRIADLHDAADLGPTVPQLDPFEEGNIGLSRRMSWLLRHGAPEKGLPLDTGGWADIHLVARICHTRPEILIGIARVSDKGRFQVAVMEHIATERREAYPFIRCVQGHSLRFIDERRLMVKVTGDRRKRITGLFHATKYVHLESILKKGLIPGGLRSARQHVHMLPYYPDLPEACGKGLTRGGGRRSDADVIIELHAETVMSEGRIMWLTASGAVVTWNRVPWSAFLKVTVGFGKEARVAWDAAYIDRAPIPYVPPNIGGLARAAAGGAGKGAAAGGADEGGDLMGADPSSMGRGTPLIQKKKTVCRLFQKSRELQTVYSQNRQSSRPFFSRNRESSRPFIPKIERAPDRLFQIFRKSSGGHTLKQIMLARQSCKQIRCPLQSPYSSNVCSASTRNDPQ